MILNSIRFHLLIFTIILMSEMSVKSENELCQNTAIYSADRLSNKTIRLFRENDFWDLEGFPKQIKVGAKGSMKDYPFFNPVRKSTRIVTVLEGSPATKDRIFKFDGIYWWSWYNHPKFGLQYTGSSVGIYWDQIPKDHGFDAVFHNGDKNEPMVIGLESNPRFSDKYMKIHYFSTENETFVRKTSKYFDEKDFPKGLTDAFSWPPTNGLKYMVYVLKDNNYCILSDKQKCTEWKSFRQLIGCSGEEKPQFSSSSGEEEPQFSSSSGEEEPQFSSSSGEEEPPFSSSSAEPYVQTMQQITTSRRIDDGGAPNAIDGETGGKTGGGAIQSGNAGQSKDKPNPTPKPPKPSKPPIPPKSQRTEEPTAEAAEELSSRAQSIAFSILSIVVSFISFIFI